MLQRYRFELILILLVLCALLPSALFSGNHTFPVPASTTPLAPFV